jgi:hypothetical protein
VSKIDDGDSGNFDDDASYFFNECTARMNFPATHTLALSECEFVSHSQAQYIKCNVSGDYCGEKCSRN